MPYRNEDRTIASGRMLPPWAVIGGARGERVQSLRLGTPRVAMMRAECAGTGD
jgi:hypothetical protein